MIGGVLLIAPPFYGYDKEIAREIRSRSSKLILFPDRPHGWGERLGRLLFGDAFVTGRYEDQLRKVLLRTPWDVCFLIKGERVPPTLIRELKHRNPKVRLVMYQWDSIENFDYRPFLDLADQSYSFDRRDCANLPQLFYKPLFFGHHFFRALPRAKRYDLSCIASYQEDRAQILSDFARFGQGFGYRSFFRLVLPVRNYLSLRTETRGDSIRPTFRRLSKAKVARIIQRSRVVLDIHSKSQSGLTMRTIEVLASGTRLITTNSMVREEAFFDPKRILVLERNSFHRQFPEIKEFIDAEAPGAVDWSDLSISAWVDDILGFSNSRSKLS